MASAKIDIDRIARNATNLQRRGSVDLLSLEKLPIEPWGWQMLVEPLEPVEVSEGGIVLPEESKQADEIQTTVARVLRLGPAALDGLTQSGLKLAKLIPKADGSDTTPEDLIGQYLIFQRYTGYPITLRKYGNKKVLLISVTEVLAGVNDPSGIKFYI